MFNKNKILFIFAVIAFTNLTPRLSYAETIVHRQDMVSEIVWYKDGSPYVMDEPIRIASTSSLTIKQGTTVTSVEGKLHSGGYIWSEGSLRILGIKDDPVIYST